VAANARVVQPACLQEHAGYRRFVTTLSLSRNDNEHHEVLEKHRRRLTFAQELVNIEANVTKD